MHPKLYICFLCLLALSCSTATEQERIHSAYYWTTSFQWSEKKTDFIRDNHIRRLYIRFFDVVMTDNGPMPNATIEFQDTIPKDIEVVPTVFIMNECMAVRKDELPHRIVDRILKMCSTHELPNVREIQIDCDWTARTQDNFFHFLEEVRELLKAKGKQLSVTIRLHQLSMMTPPADRGILMVYNTGDVTDRSCPNPILDIRDVQPYLAALDDYKLSLSAAYPVFSWDVLFHGNHFVGIQHYEGEYPTMPGDTVITHSPSSSEILKVKHAVGKADSGVNDEIILYDLSDKNLNRYSKDDFADFYE